MSSCRSGSSIHGHVEVASRGLKHRYGDRLRMTRTAGALILEVAHYPWEPEGRPWIRAAPIF
jgi:hypothetical protein